ncbi:MAG TPA: hypothetical protein VH183_04555 [Burkholderiaceae bacterium]|jgi:hypothetical protein|nr:hypothetical protein [Burkholderiaceae bacterium]
MPLTDCTLTGIDETTPLVELAVVSDMYPYAEWAFLYSPKRLGTPGRYPSLGRIQRAFRELPRYVRVALHVCGSGVAELLDGEHVVRGLFEQVRTRDGRIQLNFDAGSGEVDLGRLREFMLACASVPFITQHNESNQSVTQALAGVANHAILFDSSLGRGITPQAWRPATESVACGYAGGLGPENLGLQLPRIYDAAASTRFWISMESRLRDENDRFSMSFARKCLEIVSVQASERLDFPAPRPMRRRCEPLELIDSGLMRNDDNAREFETMLRLLLRATRDAVDPQVLDVRRAAENLLLRKGTMFMPRPEAQTLRPAAPGLTS